MKKIRLLIIALLLFVFIPTVDASTNTIERNYGNNYGVNKKWNMSDSEKLNRAKKSKYVDASEKIYDFSNILTDREEELLLEKIKPMIEEYKMDIVILTDSLSYTRDSENEDFACDFYDYNDFGIDFNDYSGVIFFRNTNSSDPYYAMYSFGEAEKYYSSEIIDKILDNVYYDISGKRYYSGLNRWLDYLKQFHTSVIGTEKDEEYGVKERTEENNYGVNKKWDMSDPERLNYAKQTKYVDASIKIYDFSGIISDEDEKKLLERITPLIEKYKMDIVILTYYLPYSSDSQNEDFATDFYDFNDFGLDFSNYSGVLLFRNTYSLDTYCDMYSFGEAQQYYTPERMNAILNDIKYDINTNRYVDGFNKWITNLQKYYEMGKVEYTYIDENGLLRYKRHFEPLLLGNFMLSSIITIIVLIVSVSKHKMVKLATEASVYLNKESFKLNSKTDTLVNSVTTSWTEPEHTSYGGGGGGHSSFGHSGGGHSSGGGFHGGGGHSGGGRHG
ncbi:MAG: TPM domain-containing protein [Bacilli bacterium]|nr:TPM domain-containing protein [Bacilli bacterium]